MEKQDYDHFDWYNLSFSYVWNIDIFCFSSVPVCSCLF